MTTAKDILKQIKDNDIKFVDLRFTDPKGKMQHVTMDVLEVDEDMFADGVMFDGSSIAGWKAINESDMVLMPDTETAHVDPFFAQSTLVVVCDILDPVSGEPYKSRPARHGQRRGLHEVGRRRRHHLCRPGSRVLRVRRRQ
jgi:glutamine synthetase